jgi:hypothetical protein
MTHVMMQSQFPMYLLNALLLNTSGFELMLVKIILYIGLILRISFSAFSLRADDRKYFSIVVSVVCCTIWKFRNECIFQYSRIQTAKKKLKQRAIALL